LKVVVYEHLSGGGYSGKSIPLDTLSEGFGMLRCIASDFKAANHQVTVLLDARISKLNPLIPADYTLPILSSEEPAKFLVNAAKINDAVYIIAPETGQTLQTLVYAVEQTGKVSLNCKSIAIQKVADKASLYEILKKKALPTPNTISLNVSEGLPEIRREIKSKSSYPVVFKPADGVSCSGLSVVKNDTQLEKAVARIKTEASSAFVVQEFVEGEATSVSVLAANGKALALSLNKQNVFVATPQKKSSYLGGVVPFNHPLQLEAFRLAEETVSSVPGLRGYVGVDLILTKNKPLVVDVNPRLTSSYIGLCKTAQVNVAQALVEAVLNCELPTKNENHGFTCFSKIFSTKPKLCAFQKTVQLPEVVSPPFPLANKTCAMVAGVGSSIELAESRLEEAKKRLINIISRGS
jgi:tyramine---L-glutamate ligase